MNVCFSQIRSRTQVFFNWKNQLRTRAKKLKQIQDGKTGSDDKLALQKLTDVEKRALKLWKEDFQDKDIASVSTPRSETASFPFPSNSIRIWCTNALKIFYRFDVTNTKCISMKLKHKKNSKQWKFVARPCRSVWNETLRDMCEAYVSCEQKRDSREYSRTSPPEKNFKRNCLRDMRSEKARKSKCLFNSQLFPFPRARERAWEKSIRETVALLFFGIFLFPLRRPLFIIAHTATLLFEYFLRLHKILSLNRFSMKSRTKISQSRRSQSSKISTWKSARRATQSLSPATHKLCRHPRRPRQSSTFQSP